jgi:ATP-dependent RNA helicase DeaD
MSPSTRKPADTQFSQLGLTPQLVEAVGALGYEEATPVQRETIPTLLAGRDLIAQAETGTGKTAAFALPMIQTLTADAGSRGGDDAKARKPKTGARPTTRGLVLVPTRELAVQVAEAAHKYARGAQLAVVPLYGGASMTHQIRALERGADLVVATPGRALDHLRRGSLTLDDLRVLVLDEADEMLDMGFAEDIDAILVQTPKTRQTALFSATMPARLRKIAERHLNDPVTITVAREKTAAGKLPRVRQVAYVVSRAHKATALQRVLDMESPSSAIVFCRTRLEVDTLVETLVAHGYRAEALHGGMQQRQRDAVMGRFRSGKVDLLIATDVAARGLDIQQLSHVFNYDVPSAPEDYVHRIGRTGRAGREGTAITLAEPREHRLLRSIESATRHKIEVATVPTVADLRARRLDLLTASLRERLLAGGLDDVRVVIETLAQEFDVVDIAAAAVAVAHASDIESGQDDDVPAAQFGSSAYAGRDARSYAGRDAKRPGATDESRGGQGRSQAGPESGMTRLFVGAGRRAGIRPGDLVGAITNEAGITARQLGAIQIADSFSLVDVADDVAEQVIASMRGATLRGQRAQVRRDRST